MSRNVIQEQFKELMKRDYKVPRLVDLSSFHMDTVPESMKPNHINLREVLSDVIHEMEMLQSERNYLMDIVRYFTHSPNGHSPSFEYMNNPAKQEFMNDIAARFPKEKWWEFYPKDSQTKGDEK